MMWMKPLANITHPGRHRVKRLSMHYRQIQIGARSKARILYGQQTCAVILVMRTASIYQMVTWATTIGATASSTVLCASKHQRYTRFYKVGVSYCLFYCF